MTIRVATDADGAAIGTLFAKAGHPDFGVDWTTAKVGGWWLVADAADGTLAGAVLAVSAQPFGYVGELIVQPAWRGRDGDGGGHLTGRLGHVAYDLLVTAFVVLRSAGSQMVVGLIGEGDDVKPLQAIYERHGALDLGTFRMMGRRLT